MEVLSLTLVLTTIFGWCVLASRLQRVGLTAPIVLGLPPVWLTLGVGGSQAASAAV
jgi:hypothetical protein